MKKLITLFFILLSITLSAQKRSTYSDGNKMATGAGLTIGGVAFTFAAAIEGGQNYGTYQTTSPATATSSQKVTYVTPPIWRQTPRNIMFVVGGTLTITGLITMISGK